VASTPLGILDPEWQQALLRIRKARQQPHYIPATLIAVLDLLEEQHLELPFVPFALVEVRFAQLLDRYHLSGRDRAWEPFFTLSGRAQVWTLYRGDRPADFTDLAVSAGRTTPRPKSRAGLVRRADRARFRPELTVQLQTLQNRAPLRRELERMFAAR
jgi:hypothetical protein